MSSYVDSLETEKTTFHRQLKGFQHDYDDVLLMETRATNPLKKSRASVEEVCRNAEQFRNKFPTYNDQFKTDIRKGFAVFSIQFRDATKTLVKKRDFRIDKSFDINFTVVYDMLQVLESEPSQLGPDSNVLD